MAMRKDFEQWSKQKKVIDDSMVSKMFFCRERDIWWCVLGLNIGIEIDGKNDTYERPVLILRVFNKDMVWILPITSVIKHSNFYHSFVFKSEKQSVSLSQIKTISTKRLRRKVGVLSEEDFGIVLNKTQSLFKIKNETPPGGGESRSPKA